MIETTETVPRHTDARINREIEDATAARLAYYAEHTDEIPHRLEELDVEWDVERAISTEAATTMLVGLVLGATRSPRWFLLPAVASAMLLLHNLQGWYPLLPLFRRMGLRTSREISIERYALKALRGDFERMADDTAVPSGHASNAFLAAQPHRLNGGSHPSGEH